MGSALFSDVVFVEAPELPKLCHPIKKFIGTREYFDSIIVGPIIKLLPSVRHLLKQVLLRKITHLNVTFG